VRSASVLTSISGGCLLISEVPFLCSLIDWKLVAPERRLQPRRATEAQIRLTDQAYQQIQREYKAMRQALFTFMGTFANSDQLIEGSSLKERSAELSRL
jgi:hypothetical protein